MPPAKRQKHIDLSAEVITILVGKNDNTKIFRIHQSLLTNRSDFFKKAMQHDWKEAEEKLVKLPEDDSHIFGLYQQLIYGVDVIDLLGKDTKHEPNSTEDGGCQERYNDLCRLYVLADKLQDREAKDDAVRAMIKKHDHEATDQNISYSHACLRGVEAINIMYGNTGRACPGRKVLVRLWSFYGGISEGDNWAPQTDTRFPIDFERDLLRELLHYNDNAETYSIMDNIHEFLEYPDI